MATTQAPSRRQAGLAGTPALRVSPPPPRRSLPLVAAGLVVMIGFGLVSVWLQASAGRRSEVLAVAQPVPAGSQIRAEDLKVVRISADSSLRPLPAARRNAVVGQTAAVTLMPDTLVSEAHLQADPSQAAGKVVVGLSLKPGQAPATLRPGTEVTVLATGSAAALAASGAGAASSTGGQDPRGVVLVRRAAVVAVDDERSSDNLTVSLLVGEDAAPVIAGAAAVGQVAVAAHPGP